MKKGYLFIVVFCMFSGCIPVFIGAGVVTGYMLSNDCASGTIKSEYRDLWDECLDELENLEAEILSVNESKGTIKAVVSENSVTIKIDTISPTSQRLKVSSRRCMVPKPQFAQKVFLKITDDLK